MKKFSIFLLAVMIFGCVKVKKKNDVQPEIVPSQEAAAPSVQPEETPPPPVIFSLNEILSLKEDMEIIADEVHLGPEARVYNNQFSLVIRAGKMSVASGAIIQTFANGTDIALVNTPGLPGGTVQIKINGIVEGNLQVFMNGQQGGEGKAGWAVLMPFGDRANCLPASGKDSGRSGSFFLEASASENFFITKNMHVAAGGEIGDTITDQNQFFSRLRDALSITKAWKESCDVIPYAGYPGSPGQICLRLKSYETPICESF